jgi:hypothetical protein
MFQLNRLKQNSCSVWNEFTSLMRRVWIDTWTNFLFHSRFKCINSAKRASEQITSISFAAMLYNQWQCNTEFRACTWPRTLSTPTLTVHTAVQRQYSSEWDRGDEAGLLVSGNKLIIRFASQLFDRLVSLSFVGVTMSTAFYMKFHLLFTEQDRERKKGWLRLNLRLDANDKLAWEMFFEALWGGI